MRVLRGHPALWLVTLGGWLVAGALALGWFWIPDSSAAGVVWSGVQLLAAAAWLLLLPAATLHYLAGAQAGGEICWREAFARAGRQTPRLLVWAAPAAALVWYAGMRTPAWVVAPLALGIVLPSLALAALPGPLRERGVRVAQAMVPGIPAALAAWALWSWRPGVTGLGWEIASLLVRAGLAYLIAAAGWLLAAARAAAPPAASRAESS
jgi:hypothetical protein